MKWIEMTVFTTEQGLDAVAARFDMLGIQQVMIEQGRESIEAFLKETAKYWDYADTDELVAGEEPCVKAYLADAGENMELVHLAEASFDALRKTDVGIDLGSLRFVVRLADDEDWANNWKAYYKPLKIGSRLLVRPSWESLADAEGRTVLSLDPGMAFGTGSHHTTRMCLEYLEKIIKNGDALLDLGCGSGILSIAGVLLGAKTALAVDIDPIAEKIAYENAELNGVGRDRYEVRIGDVLTDAALRTGLAARQYEVITANIVASVIIALLPVVPPLLKTGGAFITSGIIRERLDEVKDAIVSNGLTVVETNINEEWCAILARKE
ncbi:MAG: 50S ribosomal protein L11 methyltransferase [Christensenella sp.]|jgi:ribosomal protein L11 methyltransferase|nr:50S ribosomal protein L11 methyltransferase [Christensenella sp.]